MNKRTSCTLGPDLAAGEVLRDDAGRSSVTSTFRRATVDAARAHVCGRGRPSLSQAGGSPLFRVRLPAELDQAVRRAAEWGRHVARRVCPTGPGGCGASTA